MTRESMNVTSSATARNALVVIAVVVAGAALYWLRGILTPLALALFLLMMINGLQGVIRERAPQLPQWASLPLAIGLILLAFGLSVSLIVNNAASFAGKLAAYAPQLNELIAQVADLLGVDQAPTLQQLYARLNPARFVGPLARSVQNFSADAVFVLIYLGFLLAARSNFRRKKSALFGHGEERREADDILTRIGDAAEKYLWVQTVTGLMIAFACWLVMVIVGLDNALFWAFFIFLTSYIPIVGPAIGCILPSIFAVVQFGLSWQPLVIFGGTQAINFTVGNLIYPRMQAQSMNIDPVVVLFSLAFWSALWGLTGAFLSTPLTVMGMVVLAQFEGTKWIAILLSENGQPLGARKPEKRLLGGRPPAKGDKPAAGKSVTKA